MLARVSRASTSNQRPHPQVTLPDSSLCYHRFHWSLMSSAKVIVSRKLRIIFVSIGIFLLVLLLVPFLIPGNQFRPSIEEKTTAALGRKVKLGNLRLSLFSSSLAAEDLSIGDDPNFSPSPFLTAKSLKVGVE